MFKKAQSNDEQGADKRTFFKEDPAPTTSSPVEPDRKEKPWGIQEALKDVLLDVTQDDTPDTQGYTKHLKIVLALSRGERIVSDPVAITPLLEVKFVSLTSRHRRFIAAYSTNWDKKDEDGKYTLNENLNRSMSLAMMWHSVRAKGGEWKELPDVLGSEKHFGSPEESFQEVRDRMNQLDDWPAEWTKNYEEELVAFNKILIEAVTEENVKNFSEAPSE